MHCVALRLLNSKYLTINLISKINYYVKVKRFSSLFSQE